MIYLVHFQERFHHAQHYMGFCDGPDNFVKRIERHRRGDGSRLLRAVTKAGIKWEVVRVWSIGDRHNERSMKKKRNHWRFCPVCRAKRLKRP